MVLENGEKIIPKKNFFEQKVKKTIFTILSRDKHVGDFSLGKHPL